MGVASDLHLNVKQVIRLPFAFNTTGISSGVKIGTLPAGAVITAVELLNTAAFNAGTTNVIIVGTAADDDAYAAAADLAEAAGFTRYSAKAALLSADTDIFVKYTQSGTAATTGAGVVMVEYVTDN